LTNDIYYAPEKLKNFNKQCNEASLKKEAIFSLGMTLLHAARLRAPMECYDLNEKVFLDFEL
jgi:hypothetical protein